MDDHLTALDATFLELEQAVAVMLTGMDAAPSELYELAGGAEPRPTSRVHGA